MIKKDKKWNSYWDPEELANDFLNEYFQESCIEFPLNPFQILKDMHVALTFSKFKKLEGVYMPAEDEKDVDLVSINVYRPITRQRFTAAHELCHFLHDSQTQQTCMINSKSPVERFADSFAAAFLMPLDALKEQVDRYSVNGYVTFDDVLEISRFFGVSFESCLYRIAYKLRAIEGETDSKILKRRISLYKPHQQCKIKGYSDLLLYEGLMNSIADNIYFEPNDHAKLVFQNEYIYNDSRMEGIDVELEQSSEIVTDLRTKKNNSKYCNDKNEPYMSVAGNYEMYQNVFNKKNEECSIHDIKDLHMLLFSCYPFPEGADQFRSGNVVVTGAKFDVPDYRDIIDKIYELEDEWILFYKNRNKFTICEYIEEVIRIHHRLTEIHPFFDGNGRTLRAFMNKMLVCGGVTPLYIHCDDKAEYLAALHDADVYHSYDRLYEFIFRQILLCKIELEEIK